MVADDGAGIEQGIRARVNAMDTAICIAANRTAAEGRCRAGIAQDTASLAVLDDAVDESWR